MNGEHKFSIILDDDLFDRIEMIKKTTARSKGYIIRSILKYYFNSNIDIFELDKRERARNSKTGNGDLPSSAIGGKSY